MTEDRTTTTVGFAVQLATQPSANVTLGVSSGDATKGMASPAALTFLAGTWNMVQTVTASVAADEDASDETVTMTHTVNRTADAGSYPTTLAVTEEHPSAGSGTLHGAVGSGAGRGR